MSGTGIVHINEDFSNISQFINSLFNPDVRSEKGINTAIRSGSYHMFFSPSDAEKILKVWLAAWRKGQGDPFDEKDFTHCPESDQCFFKVMGDYIAQNEICMFLPSITYLGPPMDYAIPIYQLNRDTGYLVKPFLSSGRMDYNVVEQFLTLFLSGAHFVGIQSNNDLPPKTEVTPFYPFFKQSQLKDNMRPDPGNSHYTSTVNRCGLYYPVVKQNTAPDPCPFILSFLTCPTISRLLFFECNHVVSDTNQYSTFFQLEGWQAIYPRHNEDYETYKTFLWNISTFGSCAYSEKRATTIFMAPSQWHPEFNTSTYMAPYVGAKTLQPWLDTHTVRLSH